MISRGITYNPDHQHRPPHPFRVFSGSYLLMVLWSVFELVPRWLHMIIILLWLFGLLLYAYVWGRRTGRHLVLILNIIVAQLPGLVLSGFGLWTIEHGHVNEWMNGGLEIWTSPFLRLWEWLPLTSYRGLSAAYLAACLTPYLFVTLQILWYLAAQRRIGKYQRALH